MRIIDHIDEKVVARTVARCRDLGIAIPTFAEMREPTRIPEAVRRRLPGIGLWDVHPLNLYRITWKNDPETGLFHDDNWVELPPSLTGVEARIVGLVGRWFPTGSHKVGAGFGCLVPRLVSGAFDPTIEKAVWPSTGNFCRGGAFDCALLGCPAIAILPEEMSAERFDWLRGIGAEVVATPGCESSVKEVYDECWRMRRTRSDVVIFNQFEEFGNPIWHYWTTGPFAEEVLRRLGPDVDLAAWVSATGSAGTIAAGDYLRPRFPHLRVVAAEALQCPTLLQAGFGGHRIEGIGDKHVPWVHNVRNTDVVVAIDDEAVLRLMRLFHEPAGRALLASVGVPGEVVARLDLMGLSSICNLLAAIKTAKYFEMGPRDVLLLPFTDSMDLYRSRIAEERARCGPYTERDAIADRARHLIGQGQDHLRELGYRDRKALHNLKYFTWVEQQGRGVDELRALWDPDWWDETFAQVEEWDVLIREFNARTGVLTSLGASGT